MNEGDVLSRTYCEPIFFSICVCPGFLTILITGILFFVPSSSTILPRALAAALFIIALCLFSFTISKKASAVSGFTSDIDPCSSSTFALSGKHIPALVTIYSAQLPLVGYTEEHATRFPIQSSGRMPLPAATTVPLPSSPGIKVARSYSTGAFLILARSDGLTGDAFILIRTSPGPGSGILTSLTMRLPPGLSRNKAFIVNGITMASVIISGSLSGQR
jgi:hypothetical protein